VCEFYHEDPYIEVKGSFCQLNRVGLEVMHGRVAIHVDAKSRPEPTESVAGRPRGWAGRPALEPH
jgi:hypothetical protein